jgi:hypothetical protein
MSGRYMSCNRNKQIRTWRIRVTQPCRVTCSAAGNAQGAYSAYSAWQEARSVLRISNIHLDVTYQHDQRTASSEVRGEVVQLRQGANADSRRTTQSLSNSVQSPARSTDMYRVTFYQATVVHTPAAHVDWQVGIREAAAQAQMHQSAARPNAAL